MKTDNSEKSELSPSLRITCCNKAHPEEVYHEITLVGLPRWVLEQLFHEWNSPTSQFNLTVEPFDGNSKEGGICESGPYARTKIGTCVFTGAPLNPDQIL